MFVSTSKLDMRLIPKAAISFFALADFGISKKVGSIPPENPRSLAPAGTIATHIKSLVFAIFMFD